MKSLINLPKLGDVGGFGMLSIAICMVSAVLYVLASGFIGGGAA
jgi:hypothetical protein